MGILGPDGKPVQIDTSKLDFKFVGIPVAIAKNQSIVSPDNKSQMVATFLFIVPAHKLELYSRNEKVLMDVIVTNALGVYLFKVKEMKIEDLSDAGIKKEMNAFLRKYEVLLSPNVFPLDDIVFDDLSEEEITKAIKEYETMSEFVQSEKQNSLEEVNSADDKTD